MKAIVKAKAELGLWMEDVAKPTPGRGEVLIKIRKTAVCGTDLHIYKWDEWAQKTVPVPMVIGHEFMGEIVELGEAVKGFAVGDRVSGEGHLVCGICRNCRAGKRHLCRNTEGIGYDCPGVFTEYFAMPAVNVIKLPNNISDDVASILDPYGNAVHTALHFKNNKMPINRKFSGRDTQISNVATVIHCIQHALKRFRITGHF